ncbi:MAG: sulfatase-like hydrolase/transferase [Deltaproteobacteria bacterium]|nr:sulfatase-like hydrolase/transferase [Deltaproteobacteria bacterium]
MAFRTVTFYGVLALAALSGCGHEAPGESNKAIATATSASAQSAAPAQAPQATNAAAAPGASASSARPAAGPLEPMNVILLVVDAMRDDMPWNGYARPIAPNLTKLHEKSVSWERGYSISSFTAKSVGGLLSGHYPSSLKRNTPFFTTWKLKNDFFAEALQKQHVRTIGAHAHMYFKEAAGFHQGFDVWELVPKIEWDFDKDPYITGPDHAKLIINQLSRPENVSGRFFAYYHFMDPHHDYNSHEEAPHWGKKNRDRYDEEMWFTDVQVQKVLDFVASQPWGKRTAIIVTGDHGEAFGEHDLLKHAFEVYEVLVKVPLFVYVPGLQAKRIPRWRSHIDLAPTIFELLGAPKQDDLPGTSLVPEITGEPAAQRPIVCDLPADVLNVRHRAVIDEQGYKLIAFGKDVRYELYNVREDPEEKVNLFKTDRARADAMVKRYKEISKGIPFVKAEGGKPVKSD